MSTIKVIGRIDDEHRLTAKVPSTLSPGQVEVLVLVPSLAEDEAPDSCPGAWVLGIAREWEAELSDPREDIYSLADGEPLDASG